MGLAIAVGIMNEVDADPEGAEYFRSQLDIVNGLLEEAGLPRHEEPSKLPELESRSACSSFPYSFLHHLRRAAAHRRRDPAFVASPLPEGQDPTEDEAIEETGAGFDFHLLVHSDAEGFYVPVDFEAVIFDGDDRGLAGGMLGSSQRLLTELVEVAPALGIRLKDDGTLSDAEARRINDSGETDEGLYREHTAWIALYEAARLSVAHRTAVVFT